MGWILILIMESICFRRHDTEYDDAMIVNIVCKRMITTQPGVEHMRMVLQPALRCCLEN